MKWTDVEGRVWTGKELAAKIRGVGRFGRVELYNVNSNLFCAAGLLAYSKDGEFAWCSAARDAAADRLGDIYFARHHTFIICDNDGDPNLSPEARAEYMAQRFDQLD